MSKKDQRMETMKNAGVDTGKYFSFKLSAGLKPGASITLVINEDGVPVMMNKTEATATDRVKEQIFANGYVKNTRLHRRWVMAHMFRMLNYTSWDGKEKGYDAALRYWHGFDYQFDVLADEIKTLSKLEVSDREIFTERETFFNKKVVIATCNDYMQKLEKYVSELKVKHCKHVPYVTVKGEHVFVEDLNKKVYLPLRLAIMRMNSAKNYKELKNAYAGFRRVYVKLPYKTPKCREWKDAFKGAGAYYTLKNMIMYHNCYIFKSKDFAYDTMRSMEILNELRKEYTGEGWRMFGLMKKVIKDNTFDFDKRMKEIYE